MSEQNNPEEEYIEEEIEVYEEIEVDEEEETNDIMSSNPKLKQKSKSKINIVKNKKIPTINNNENSLNIIDKGEKKEIKSYEQNINNESDNNKLELLSDKIKSEKKENFNNNILEDNNNEINDFKFNIINNFNNLDDNTNDNKYLNLDYKIESEKDNLELPNTSNFINQINQNQNETNLNLNQNEMKSEIINKEKESNKNNEDNKKNNNHQTNNFRSKIKRNNKKINKIDININKSNKINIDNANNNNNIQIKLENTRQSIDKNNNQNEHISQSLNIQKDFLNMDNHQNEKIPINNNLDEIIKYKESIPVEEEENNNEENKSNIYDVIQNNISHNFEKINNENLNENINNIEQKIEDNNILKSEKKENEIENNEINKLNIEESDNEKNKIKIKKSKEDTKYESEITQLTGNSEIVELLDSKKWEEKKQGFIKLNQFLKENTDNDIIKNNFENLFSFISSKLNNFKETNFNLLKEGIISLNILFSYSKEKNNQINKQYLEIIITNLNEKISDTKIKENYIQLLNTLIGLYSHKIVYELLLEILLKTNKVNVLKEYALFIKDNIKKENSLNDIDIKNLIEFSVKIANHTNPQIRSIAIEIIGLLYTFIGPDLKQLITGIKESTLKLIEKEIDKLKINKNIENKDINNVKELIVKKSKNNSEKNNENNNGINNSKRIDISKELTSKLLREINRGKWIEKKEGIEYINAVIDKTNNKISKNGLQDLFELIKDKLNDGNQNFVKMILQLLNHLIISLEAQIKFFYNNLVYPLLLKLSDKSKLIRDECISCIENWIKMQNFEIFAIYIPQLLISNENLEMRTELLNLLSKYKSLIKSNYPKIFFKEMTKAFLTCLQDKNVKIRNITEELISSFSNFIPREKYILELKDIKSTISDYLFNIIDKLLPILNEENFDKSNSETKEKENPNEKENQSQKENQRESVIVYNTNNDNDIMLVNKSLFSPKKITKNKNKKNKSINPAFSLEKNFDGKNKETINNKRSNRTKNFMNQTTQMNATVLINTKRNKIVKNIKSKLMGYNKLSSTLNKKSNEIQQSKNNNNPEIKKIKKKDRNSSMILDSKNKIIDNNLNKSDKKDLKSLTAEKIIKTKKISTNNNNHLKNESFTKRPIKKINPKKFLNSDTNGKNKLFLPSYKIKKGLKEKRFEKDKKNNFFSELQNFDYLPKINEYFKNIFTPDFITKIFSNDLKSINAAISLLKLFMDESLNTNNEENFNKLIDNLDLILKVIASKIFNNQTASLIKSFFIFADTLINIYKIRKYTFNDTEINILLNIFVDKLTNSNVILKDTACNLIWFLNDQIEPSKTFITLVHLLEYKNAKIKSEIIDIIIKLYESSNFNTSTVSKILKNLIRLYFDSDFNSKKKLLFLLQNIYNLMGNDFWKYTIFLSSKDRDELEKYLENENEENYEDKNSSKEYEIDDLSSSNFEYDDIDKNDVEKKESEIKDINEDNMKFHITEDEKHNKNHIFKRSITDHSNTLQKNDDKTPKIIDKNNYNTNIPSMNIKSDSKKEDDSNPNCVSEKELLEYLKKLANPEEDLVEAIIKIHYIAYRNYHQNKKILNENSDKIISSFIDIITKLFSSEPLLIKMIKYYILVLCKLCNIKEFISNIKLETQKNLITLILSNLLRENLNTLGENDEGTLILKSLNSIITHIIEFCNITKNIEIIIDLEKNYRKDKPKLAEYSGRCLIIVIQNIKNSEKELDYNIIFGKINEILQDLILEDSELQLKDKTNQTILITLRNLINELTKANKNIILDIYNKWIKEANITNEKYILTWIKESLARININKNINLEKYDSNNNNKNIYNKNNNIDDNEKKMEGNRKKSLNEIKKKWKELQDKESDN